MKAAEAEWVTRTAVRCLVRRPGVPRGCHRVTVVGQRDACRHLPAQGKAAHCVLRLRYQAQQQSVTVGEFDG